MFELLFYGYLIIIIIQICYYIGVFGRFSFAVTLNSKKKDVEINISLIICAKNESENLVQNLPFIINQNYTNFELILVNDNSTDNTLEILNTFKAKYQDIDITVININDGISNKKKALTKGINTSKYEYLLLTDADCKPVSKNWITKMSIHFNKNKTLILGYGAHQKIKKSWLNKLIRFETLLTAIQYFSYTKIGLAYMGVGRNMAYKKSDFDKTNGFQDHKHIKSGDDDLFINQISTAKNTTICFSKDSFTISKPHISFKKWLLQKRRHITTATHYKPVHQTLLGVFYVSQFLFWFLTITLLLNGFNLKIVTFLFTFRIGLQYLIFGFSAKKLNEKDLILFIPFLELFLITIQMYIFIKNLIHKPTHW